MYFVYFLLRHTDLDLHSVDVYQFHDHHSRHDILSYFSIFLRDITAEGCREPRVAVAFVGDTFESDGRIDGLAGSLQCGQCRDIF